jgi:uncharacterized protein YjdB
MRNYGYHSAPWYTFLVALQYSGIYAYYVPTYLVLDSGITTIGAYAFYDIRCGHSTLHIPSGVTTIGSAAFYGYGLWNNIIIPASVTTIGDDAFTSIGSGGSTGDMSVTCYAAIPPPIDIGSSPFHIYDYDHSDGRVLYVPATSIGLYRSDRFFGNSNYGFSEIRAIPGTEILPTQVTISGCPVDSLIDNDRAAYTLTASIAPSNATYQNITWSVNNSVAACTSGVVRVERAGTAVITASAHNGVQAQCVINVKSSAVRGVSLNRTTLPLAPGSSQTLTAAIVPSYANNKAVTWSSSNMMIASVDANGKVTAHNIGAGVVITATTEDGGFTAQCVVTVSANGGAEEVAVTGVSLNMTTLSLRPNAAQQLTATISPSNAANKNMTWTSSNAGVASVDNTGIVTAHAAGSATITVTTADGGFTKTCVVTVSANDGADDGGSTAVEAQPLSKLQVHPNPAGSMLYITDEFVGVVEIYDINGTLLLTSTSNSINISALPSGIYIVKAGSKSAKVVKQ